MTTSVKITMDQSKKTKRDGLKIANLVDGLPDPSIMNYPTEKGFF